ncbi:MAG TPA: cation:proton antiporter [Planctomycetota bacterium]|jgi:Kef-type K+ transport system membrane component KefB|nr:cation:proton antiporter [Planctomycetota bacterium]
MDSALVACILAALAFLASLVSVELGISCAIVEIAAGVLAGNVLRFDPPSWLDFLAGFGGILLTFLAGAEVDPHLLRTRWRASFGIGGISFLAPFAAAYSYARWGAGWSNAASLIAGIALSTTSLAVVYAVLVEMGLSGRELGKLLMAATFVTDLGTAVGLSVLFAEGNAWTLGLVAFSVGVIGFAARVLPPVFTKYGARVIEPEIKLLFLILFAFMWVAKLGRGHAVLPVFLFGLATARMFREHADLHRKLRVVAFAMITPFFFLRGGMNVAIGSVTANLGLLLAFLGVKVGAKVLGILPLARRVVPGNALFLTLLMSTGLTFGTISATYGLQAGIIDRVQFSLLVAVVILSAVVPTTIAQRWFAPVGPEDREEILAREAEAE